MIKRVMIAGLSFLAVFLTTFAFGQYEGGKKSVVKPGIDVLLEKRLDLVEGKKVGLITNPTGINSKFESSIDLLHNCKECDLVALFGPEHGVRGDYFAGEQIASNIDHVTSLPIHSLYGKTRKPTPQMLKDIDILIYDIQDIGNRGYTYIYTMAYAMQAAQENNKKFIVLDRPNPMGGKLIDGNVLDPEFSSFVGLYPIAYVYGMTAGETALFFNQEFEIGCQLEVVKMKGWHRDMKFWDTGLPWVPPSTHIVGVDSPFYCAITGILGELRTVNEGVGYTIPFELMGAPWIDGEKLAQELNRRQLPGVYFRPISYVPRYFAFKDLKCRGVQIHITDFDQVRPVSTGIHLMETVNKLYPEKKILEPEDEARAQMFDKVMGTDKVRQALINGVGAQEIITSWEPELQKYKALRQKYLLYK